MARNRIIYQNEGLFIGPAFEKGESYSTPISTNIDRVQSVSYNFTYERSLSNALGHHGSIDQPIVSSPLAALSLSYSLSSFYNEAVLGLRVMPLGSTEKVSPVSDMANETNRSYDKKNIYLATMPEGKDLIEGSSADIESVLSFHDCQLESYAANFTVGDIPSVSIGLKGIDANYYSAGTGLSIPIINKKTAETDSSVAVTGMPVAVNHADETLIPSRVSLSIEGLGSSPIKFADINNDKVQTFDFDFSVGRTPIDLVGYKINYDQLIRYPIEGQASVSFIEDGEQEEALSELVKQDDLCDIFLKIKNVAGNTIMSYCFLKAAITDMSYNSDIGSNKTSDLTFSYQLDPNSTERGLFISGQA